MYLQKNYGVSVGSNWTHFAFTFDDGTFGGGSSWASFSNNLAIIAEVRFNVNLHEPYYQFGWDDYNVVLIDNMQLAVRQFAGPPPPTPPTVPLTIFEWNMDDKPLTYTWGTYNWSADTNNPQIYIPTYTYSATTSEMAGYGVGGSNGWWLQMDNSTLAPPNTPAWAGGNTGGGGPVDLSHFTDNLLKSYVLECDVRVEGLAPDASVGVVDIPLSMDSPRGNVRLEFSSPGGSNWVHSAVDFSQANWNTGDGRLPKSSFATNYNTYTSIAIELQLNSAPNGAMWEFDTNNRVVVDNIKLVHYVAACPPLTIFTATNNVIVTWDAPSTGTAILLSGDTVAGVTNEVGPTSPYVIPIASAPKYFRTRWVAP